MSDSSESDDPTNGYYQILVPSFTVPSFTLNNVTSTTGSSLVRLGSFPSSPGTTPGFQNSYYLATNQVESDGVTPWVPPQALLAGGGFWDHTDGNRITTTVGDKIEIIQGNYNLFVNGTDTTLATMAVGPSVSNTTGSPSQPIGQGQTPPGPLTPPSSMPLTTSALSNGDVFSGTWANRVLTYLGSSAVPVPVVFSETYAGLVSNITGTENQPVGVTAPWAPPPPKNDPMIASVSSAALSGPPPPGVAWGTWTQASTMPLPNSMPTSLVVGDVLSGTWAQRMMTYVGSLETPVPFVLSETYAGSIVSNTIADAITSLQTAAGAITNTSTAGAAITNVNTAPENLTITTGLQQAINIGAVLTAYLGPESCNLYVGAIQNVNLGLQTSINLPASWQFTGLKNDISVEKAEAAATENRFVQMANGIANVTNRVVNQGTKLATQSTQISTLFEVIAGDVLLGAP
jgi:hypothetical protein